MLGDALVVPPPLLQKSHIALLNNLSWGLPDETFPSSSSALHGCGALTYKALLHASNIPLSTSNCGRLSVQYLSTLSVFPYSAPFTPHLSLCPPSQGQRGPSRHAEDSSAPIRRRRGLVSIKWYVLMPQITDTCSLLPSHPVAVASLLHHLMQRNHPHYLMRPYCTHKLSLSLSPLHMCIKSSHMLAKRYSKCDTQPSEPLPHCQQSGSHCHNTVKPLMPQ